MARIDRSGVEPGRSAQERRSLSSAVVRSIECADVADVMDDVRRIGREARNATAAMSAAGSHVKDQALLKIAALLRDGRQQIKRANARDVERARQAGVQ